MDGRTPRDRRARLAAIVLVLLLVTTFFVGLGTALSGPARGDTRSERRDDRRDEKCWTRSGDTLWVIDAAGNGSEARTDDGLRPCPVQTTPAAGVDGAAGTTAIAGAAAVTGLVVTSRRRRRRS